jgi:hypothetical protein
VPYLTALQILLDSHALVVVGSTQSYYTPSKIFPYIMAKRPLFGIFHESSSVVGILRETGAGEVVTFNSAVPPMNRVGEIRDRLYELLKGPEQAPAVQWNQFEPYTAHAITARLAAAFDQVLARKVAHE